MFPAYIRGMKHPVFTALTILALSLPAAAQETEEPSLLERGAKLFLEGLLQEMEPALDDLQGMTEEFEPALRDFAQRMGPALSDLMGQVGDLSQYELPEVLPNGDIIIRRKVIPDTETQPDDGGEGATDGPIDI